MSVILRYCSTSTGSIEENLIGFLEVTETTGEYLTNAIPGELEKKWLIFQNYRGQKYDNGTNMLSLADEQALQFAAEDNAKMLWDKIRATFIGRGEDQKIDVVDKLKNIAMKNGDPVGDYIARARGISTKCHSLGLDVMAEGIGLPYR
ncbi:retrovirus-related Pol polyprotein from transposon TNT 1-94 [Trichonephila clavipes]|nr:retrovirus-related Pol polyprotein from transposon TNT 1-94 [Trichonephila clavipes]